MDMSGQVSNIKLMTFKTGNKGKFHIGMTTFPNDVTDHSWNPLKKKKKNPSLSPVLICAQFSGKVDMVVI